jgi:hypothetical protein
MLKLVKTGGLEHVTHKNLIIEHLTKFFILANKFLKLGVFVDFIHKVKIR